MPTFFGSYSLLLSSSCFLPSPRAHSAVCHRMPAFLFKSGREQNEARVTLISSERFPHPFLLWGPFWAYCGWSRQQRERGPTLDPRKSGYSVSIPLLASSYGTPSAGATGPKIPLVWGGREGGLGPEPLVSGVCLGLQENCTDAEIRTKGGSVLEEEARCLVPVYIVQPISRGQPDFFPVKRR